LAAAAGICLLAPIVIGFSGVHDPSVRATEALTLVVPVVGAAVLGGRWAAYAVAVAAAVAFSLVIPPIGSFRIELGQDVIALCVFAGVALVVSTLVARRVEALRQVEHQRRSLLRSVSHDLRTPLSAIRAAATELQSGIGHDEAVQGRLLELIGDESLRLDRLVGNLLDLSRVEAGVLQPRYQAVDMAELVEVSANSLERMFRDVALEVEVGPDLPSVQGDFTLLGQVVTNLLENAARHSPTGSTVVVAAVVEGATMRVSVADEGPGVDPSEAATIFEPFRSGSIAGTSGIGLAICKAIIEAHAGTIRVGETAAGGAEFSFSVPLG
jgi:two-component system sensor histidine kinase KdpD